MVFMRYDYTLFILHHPFHNNLLFLKLNLTWANILSLSLRVGSGMTQLLITNGSKLMTANDSKLLTTNNSKLLTMNDSKLLKINDRQLLTTAESKLLTINDSQMWTTNNNKLLTINDRQLWTTNERKLLTTRFNKICHPSQRPRWQVDKEAIGLLRVQQCSSTYNPPS